MSLYNANIPSFKGFVRKSFFTKNKVVQIHGNVREVVNKENKEIDRY